MGAASTRGGVRGGGVQRRGERFGGQDCVHDAGARQGHNRTSVAVGGHAQEKARGRRAERLRCSVRPRHATLAHAAGARARGAGAGPLRGGGRRGPVPGAGRVPGLRLGGRRSDASGGSGAGDSSGSACGSSGGVSSSGGNGSASDGGASGAGGGCDAGVRGGASGSSSGSLDPGYSGAKTPAA